MAKIWFITGSSRGLGLAITKKVLEQGDSVIATARNPEHLSSLVDQYGPDKILALTLDVSNNTQVLQAVNAGLEKYDRIDRVVNNAGSGHIEAVEDISLEAFRAQIDVMLMGVVYVSKAVLPIMRKQGSGHIFQVSSLGGRVGIPGLSAYQSAKWAVGGFSTVLAQEVAPLGVKVTVLEPGGIRTGFISEMKMPNVSEPYQATVGAVAEMHRSLNGKETSLPERIAEIVVTVSELEKPPVRLLVGPDAVQYAGQAAEALAASDMEWRDLSLSST
ncbi:hypothetical protein B0A50_06195 [Salinomyces thailandicus]|uniref:Uncharacterized protein n=1 Tax=Salinomyces thailandicus TaxID=706561 RepID=A0A4U0TST3_9PEZI|nr:hypothetical protein B0A50_06195 [Salinomyces thailandica]